MLVRLRRKPYTVEVNKIQLPPQVLYTIPQYLNRYFYLFTYFICIVDTLTSDINMQDLEPPLLFAAMYRPTPIPLEEVSEISPVMVNVEDLGEAEGRVVSGELLDQVLVGIENNVRKDIFHPTPSPRLKKKRRNISMKQDVSECLTVEVEGLKNTINECKSKCHAKDIEIETLQKSLKSEQENFNVCVSEKDSLRTVIKSQIEELKLIKEELLLFQRLKEGKQNSTNDGQSGIHSIQSSYENLKFDMDHDKLIEKLRRDLKKKGCLLKDAQLYISKLERKKENKCELNKLRDKIENLEDEKHHLLKLKKELLLDLEEVKLEKKNSEKREKILERKYKDKMDENLSLSNQLIENEENFDDMILKYKTSINSIRKDIQYCILLCPPSIMV